MFRQETFIIILLVLTSARADFKMNDERAVSLKRTGTEWAFN